ncbi:MAG: hypothetical protein LLG37_09475 [Spirochaetia bacterium]|nr:hypothetical protein [Spirochaetia bacterium]
MKINILTWLLPLSAIAALAGCNNSPTTPAATPTTALTAAAFTHTATRTFNTPSFTHTSTRTVMIPDVTLTSTLIAASTSTTTDTVNDK